MTESPRELTKEEYEATFSPPMLNVTETAEENVPLWDYLDPVIEELYHSDVPPVLSSAAIWSPIPNQKEI